MDDIDIYIAEQEAERKAYESGITGEASIRGEGMSDTDELIEKAKQIEAEKQEKLKSVDKGIADRIAQEQESRERLSKAIGELFSDKKGKVALEMEAYFAEKDAQKRLAKKQEFASRLGLTLEELDVYLKGEKK